MTMPLDPMSFTEDPTPPTAGPSTAHPNAANTPKPQPRISGSFPGALDPTQTARLCRHPNSRLSFASFDPHTASSSVHDVPDIRGLNLNQELYRPKRVVIETTPSGESSWRFVPNARRDEEGVADEGTWPRVIEICGRLYECSLDQWDIYKLDPLYDCHVRAYPHLTVISLHPEKPKSAASSSTGHKRVTPSPSPSPSIPNSPPRKRAHVITDSSSEEEQGEVEEMIIDNGPRPPKPPPLTKRTKSKDDRLQARKERWEKMARRTEKLTTKEGDDDSSEYSTTYLGGKRKVNSIFESLKTNGHPTPDWPFFGHEASRRGATYVPSRPGKRTRTVSPTSARRDLEAGRLKREMDKRQRWQRETRARREVRDYRFMQEVLEEVTESSGGGSQSGTTSISDETDDAASQKTKAPDPEAVHRAALEESRRKLAELEADRPLWEEAAAKRRREELAEEVRRAERREAAAKARQEEKRRKEAERLAREKREREEAEKREREARAQREKERRQRQSWMYGKWSQQRAMERYLELSKMFDETKFCGENPLTVDAVPWPVLQSPREFSVEDVSWQAVEEFFEAFRSKMRLQDFKSLIEKSHRRFHPDRWRSRSLLTSVVDEVERGCMEVAANTVAQALTPLWQQLRASGRD